MEFVGRGSVEKLKNFADGRVLLFTQNGLFSLFKEKLILTAPVLYTALTENPKREEIQTAQDRLKDKIFDVIVAFGGGSVIDFAKAFKYYEKRNIPLVAVPTTAGTGSQVTQFAVVYVDGVKTSLDAPEIIPNIAIVDSQFIEKAPQYLKASCAMDAYCQAIESFWAKGATKESKEYALQAVDLCRCYLVNAVTTADIEVNEKMALAAHLAGKAINISRTTAAHALSYKITSLYGIPHGHAVALTIASLFKFNAPIVSDIDELLLAMNISKNEIISYFNELMKDIGLEDDLKKLGISDLDEIIGGINIDRLNNNPRFINKEDLIDILNGSVKA